MELSHSSSRNTSTRHQDVIPFGRYIVHEVPEAKPAILLAWADNSDDLAAIKAAGQVPNPPSLNNLSTLPQTSPDYSVTISLEYAQDFWQNALASPIYRSLLIRINKSEENCFQGPFPANNAHSENIGTNP